MPWDLEVAEYIEVCDPRSEEELIALRALDPWRTYLAEGRY